MIIFQILTCRVFVWVTAQCTPDEIMKIISELQNGKASDIPIHVIKKSSRFISPILSVLYNRCINDGIFPIELKVGKISPIYKKDKKELLEFSRLYSFLSSQILMYENQYGFR